MEVDSHGPVPSNERATTPVRSSSTGPLVVSSPPPNNSCPPGLDTTALNQDLDLSTLAVSSLSRGMRGSFSYLQEHFNGDDEDAVKLNWLKFERLMEGSSVRELNLSFLSWLICVCSV